VRRANSDLDGDQVGSMPDQETGGSVVAPTIDFPDGVP
jgi:hypothetical protein